MEISTLVPIISYGSILLFLLGAVAALWYRMGDVLHRIGRLEARTDSLEANMERLEAKMEGLEVKVDTLQAALNEKTDALRMALDEKTDALRTSLDEKTDALRTSLDDVKDMLTQMQLQMQRNHYQLMMAILSHSHRPDGRPTFDLPPDFEPTPDDE